MYLVKFVVSISYYCTMKTYINDRLFLPLCITRFECICSKALQSWTKYFQIVLSGINLRCFLKCLIILDKSPASASSKTMFSSFSSIKDARYLITFGWFNCCKYDMSILKLREPLIFNNHVKPACLPKSEIFGVGDFAFALASGWGKNGKILIIPFQKLSWL